MTDDDEVIAKLHQAVLVSALFLELEAEGHRARGDKDKAEACEKQARYNRSLLPIKVAARLTSTPSSATLPPGHEER